MTIRKIQKIKILTLLFISFLYYRFPLYADTVFLKNGMRMDVERAWKEQGEIKYEMYGTVYSYPINEVARIETETEEGKTQEEDPVSEGSDSSISPEKKGDSTESYTRKFFEFYEKKKWKEAAKAGEDLFRQDPQNKTTRQLLARFYLDYSVDLRRKGKARKEIQAIKKSLSYESKNSEGLKRMTAALVRSASKEFSNRNYDAAKLLSLEAAGFDNNNPEPYVLLGKIAYSNDDYNGARLNWQKALKRKPDYAAVRSLLGSLEKDRTVEKDLRVYESGNFILKFEGKRKQLVVDKTIKILNRAYQDVGSELSVYPDEKNLCACIPQKRFKKTELPSGLVRRTIRWENSHQ